MYFQCSLRGIALGLATSTMACAPSADEELRPEPPEVSTQGVTGCCGGGSADPNVNGLRLTLAGPSAVPSGDIANTTLNAAPYTSAAIALFDGSVWVTRIAEPYPNSPSASGLTPSTNYDVFAYWSGTEVRLEVVPWAFANGNAMGTQDGVGVKDGDPTRRYLGAVCTESDGSIRDQYNIRCVWNRYNQVPRAIRIIGSGNWSYANANSVWRSAANGSVGLVKVVIGHSNGSGGNGIGGSHVSARAVTMGHPSSGATSGWVASGIGIDSATANSAQVGDMTLGTNTQWAQATSFYEGNILSGLHTIRWLETGSGGRRPARC